MAHRQSEAILALVWVLDQISPTDVVNRKDVLQSFQQFLRRATPSQLQRLCVKLPSSPPFTEDEESESESEIFNCPDTPDTPGTRSWDAAPPRKRRRRRERQVSVTTDASFVPVAAARSPSSYRPRQLLLDHHSQPVRSSPILESHQSSPLPESPQYSAESPVYQVHAIETELYPSEDPLTVSESQRSPVLQSCPSSSVTAVDQTASADKHPPKSVDEHSPSSPACSPIPSCASSQNFCSARHTLEPEIFSLELDTSPAVLELEEVGDLFSDSGIASIPALRPATPLSSSCCQSPNPEPLSIVAEPLAENTLGKAQAFFESRLGARKNRAKFLLRATQGFIEASDIPLDFCDNIWGSKTEIFMGFEESGSVARFRRLHEGHRRIKQGQDEYAYADRLCYIFL